MSPGDGNAPEPPRISAALRDALATFSKVEREIVAVGQRMDPDTALEFVRLRRQLVMRFATLGNALEQEPWLKARPDEMRTGSQLFSAFRAQNSINQADWPVVRVRDNIEAYRANARPVAEKSIAFWRWVEQTLCYKR